VTFTQKHPVSYPQTQWSHADWCSFVIRTSVLSAANEDQRELYRSSPFICRLTTGIFFA